MPPPYSKVKEISIELANKPFWHGHLGATGCSKFLGRAAPLSRLMTVLRHSESGSGAYLVTGFRGMGKTSLVHEAIRRLNDGQNIGPKSLPKYLSISLSLSYDDVRDLDVLRQIAGQLYRSWATMLVESGNPMIESLVSTVTEKIQAIKDHIEALITQETGRMFTQHDPSQRPDSIQQRRRTTYTYSPSTPKEVERQLIDLFYEISVRREKIRHAYEHITLPRLIFIIDELDKIEPDFVTVQGVRHPEDLAEGFMPGRQRREAIARLLANLKGFLNEANAKFIFIGGREMYDASLADSADRESFYGSIFHEVIYVESFFKDRLRHNAGVTQMTEAYMCHFLLPENFAESDKDEERLTLHTVFEYLNQKLPKNSEGKQEVEDMKALDKTIFLLQNLVLFLTYRSNGTPKKLASLLEQFIVEREIRSEIVFENDRDPDAEICFYQGDGKGTLQKEGPKMGLFLRLNFKQQYEVGLTSNLYRPYVIIHSRHLKSLGDKLLFSTSYMMDYILKFHPHGFSWRNLEMIPDIILTNKDPNLRLFMRELLRFLSRANVRETLSGMFEYRFYNKISNEIKLLSKISEPGAAAFNFTLDESQQIKHYYRAKLQLQKKSYREIHPDSGDTGEFVYSISFLHNILGDLHYYDKEYDEAIIHYMDAIQPIRERIWAGKGLSSHQISHLVRTLLKYGMASTKIQAYDSLFAIFRQMVMDLPKLLDMSRLYRQEGNEKASNRTDNKVISHSEDFPLREMQLFVRPYIFMLELLEKKRQEGITFNGLQKNLEELCRLLKIEGTSNYWLLDGPNINIGHKSPENQDIIRISTLCADYFYNAGNILFFKNYNYTEAYKCFKNKFIESGSSLSGAKSDLQEINLAEFIQSRRKRVPSEVESADYFPSLTAYFYYRQAITDLLRPFLGDLNELALQSSERSGIGKLQGHFSDLTKSVFLLYPDTTQLTNVYQLSLFANLFSSLGDSVLTTASSTEHTINEALIDVYECSEQEPGGIERCIDKIVLMTESDGFPFEKPVESAMVLYRIAGLFFYKANRIYSYVFQYKKFIFVLKDWLEVQKKEKFDQSVKPVLSRIMPMLIQEKTDQPTDICSRMLHAITWESDVSNRPQIKKYRDIFKTRNTIDFDTEEIYYNISTSQEAREMIILIEDIRLKLWRLGIIKHIPKQPYLSQYDSHPHMYVRMQELRLQCEWHFCHFKQILDRKKIVGLLNVNYFKENTLSGSANTANQKEYKKNVNIWKKIKQAETDELKYHIIDSIFCLHEIVRILNLYGLNHTTNHSLLGSVYAKLANWCRAFYNIIKFTEDAHSEQKEVELFKESLSNDLRKLIKSDAIYSLEPKYYDEQALEHYYQSIQTHKGGGAYRYFLNHLSFLDDDFNDNLLHFSAASERFRINTGATRKKINVLKSKINTSIIYKYGTYERFFPKKSAFKSYHRT